MERRQFLANSGLGMFASAAIPVTPSSPPSAASLINAKSFGAKGDGKTDDTAALQAAIDAALGQGIGLFIPAGRYRTTAQLNVGGAAGNTANRSGWMLSGAGAGDLGQIGGTVISLDATNVRAIMQVGASCYRRCNFENFTLTTQVPSAAQYGMLFASTEFSNHIVRRVCVENAPTQHAGPITGFGIDQGTGRNGENILFADCVAFAVDTFFDSNAGQAYVQSFIHCGAIINTGGRYFRLATAGGGGINVFDFNGTSSQNEGLSNTTFLDLGSRTTSVCNIIGGRLEHLTQLYNNRGGSPAGGINLLIKGMQIGIDHDPRNPALNLPQGNAVVVTGGQADNAVIENCQFFADNAKATFPIQWTGQWSDLQFRACTFWNFAAAVPTLATSAFAQSATLQLIDCKSSVVGTRNRFISGDRHVDIEQVSVGRRRTYDQNARAQSGRPANCLIRSEVISTSGSELAVEPPWQIYGRAKTINSWSWNDVGKRPRSASPWARRLEIPPETGLSQELSQIPLQAAAGLNVDNTFTHLVHYQAMITMLGGACGRVQIMNGASGEIFDEFSWSGPGIIKSPFLLTLGGAIAQTKDNAFPQLRIYNADAERSLVYEFEWQMVTNEPQGCFVPSSEAPSIYGEEWGVVTDSVIAWSRFALPHKSDAYGARATVPLSNLASDFYLSATDERLTYFAQGQWWKAPRTAYAAAIPTTGTWTAGDQILSNTPYEQGVAGEKYVVVGWICVGSGTPGTWLPMRVPTGN